MINNHQLITETITQAEEESEKLKKIFILELDTPQIFTEWESLVIKYQVMGKTGA